MGLESATFLSGLVATNPIGASDPKSQGDDHLRLIKSVLLATFPNLNAAVNATPAQLNLLVGVTALNPTTAVFKAADTDRPSNTTPTNDPDLVLALAVGTYQFEAVISWVNLVITTQGIKSGFVFSGTQTLWAANFEALGQFGRTEAAAMGTAGNFANSGSAGVSQDYVLRGIITVTVAGNLQFQWSQNTSSANATRVLHASYIKATKVA